MWDAARCGGAEVCTGTGRIGCFEVRTGTEKIGGTKVRTGTGRAVGRADVGTSTRDTGSTDCTGWDVERTAWVRVI